MLPAAITTVRIWTATVQPEDANAVTETVRLDSDA